MSHRQKSSNLLWLDTYRLTPSGADAPQFHPPVGLRTAAIRPAVFRALSVSGWTLSRPPQANWVGDRAFGRMAMVSLAFFHG